MLYSMLNRGHTPWEKYKQQSMVELALAIANRENKISFDDSLLWRRQKYLINRISR